MSTAHRVLLYVLIFVTLTICVSGALYLRSNRGVENPETFDAKRALQSLDSTNTIHDSIELENIVADAMRTYGTRAGFEVIEEGSRQGIVSNDACHGLLHYVGHAAFSENPNNFDELLEIVGGTSCIGGFIHGIEAEIVLSSGNVIEDVQKFCTFQIEKNVKQGACYHGVGHAAAEMTNYNVLESLALCDALEGGPEHDLTNCYRGVFSEIANVVEGYDGHTGLQGEKMSIQDLNPDNPYLYCETFDSKYHASCKSQLTRLFSLKNMDTWVEACSTVGDIQSVSICLKTSAGMYTRDSLSFNETTKLPAAFETIAFIHQKSAILGAAEAFAGYFQDHAMKDWETFCNSMQSVEAKQYCQEVFDLLLRNEAKPWDLFDELYNELGAISSPKQSA